MNTQDRLQRRGLVEANGDLTPQGERVAEQMHDPDPEPFRQPIPQRFWDPGPMNDCGTM